MCPCSESEFLQRHIDTINSADRFVMFCQMGLLNFFSDEERSEFREIQKRLDRVHVALSKLADLYEKKRDMVINAKIKEILEHGF